MKQNKETLKTYFETGDKPTQQEYTDLIDSYVDNKQPEGEANRRFVIDETGEVNVASEKTASVYTLSDIVANKLSLLKDGEVVKEIDLTTYVDDTNLARLVSGVVDVNGIATFKRDDNSTFTVDLSNLKDTQLQADFNQTDNTKPDYIKGFPLAVLDYNGAKKFEANEIQFDKYFHHNGAEKEVKFHNDKFVELSDRMLSTNSSFITLSFSSQIANYNILKYEAVNDIFIASEKTGKRIFELSVFSEIGWRNHSDITINDLPTYLRFNIYLQPDGGSFINSEQDGKLLLATIEVLESEISNLSRLERSFYSLKIPLIKKSTKFSQQTHELTIPVKTYDVNGNVKSTSNTTAYFYINNSYLKREIDTDISFQLATELVLNYDGKTTATPWGVHSSLDSYMVEVIK